MVTALQSDCFDALSSLEHVSWPCLLKLGSMYAILEKENITQTNSVGQYVIPCDFFAKIDIFALFDCYRCSLHKNHGVQFFQAQEPILGSYFQKLALESIEQHRVTPHNIELIVF